MFAMFKCLNCGEVFEEPCVVRETHGFTDGSYEEFGSCPWCGGDFEEAAECECCGRFFTTEDAGAPYGDYCVDCAEEAFTVELGLEFLKRYELEVEFFTDYLPGAYGAHDPKFVDCAKQLRLYCLEDITGWIDFLCERSAKAWAGMDCTA